MSANALLLWMSARGQGSWQQFRAAVEELHLTGLDEASADDEATDPCALPLYQEVRLNLQRLGHAEFFSGAAGSDWRVTPPSLAVTKQSCGYLGMVAGARSTKLLQVLRDAVPGSLETHSLSACPDQIMIKAAEAGSLASVAESAGLLLQLDAPCAILTSLPAVDDISVRRRADLPFGAGWKIDRFSEAELGWRPATRENALSASAGLFRFSLRHQRHSLFCEKGQAFQLPAPVGKYLALKRRRRRVIRYEAKDGWLSVPASCRPPFLIERALILCSGKLPSYSSRSNSPGILRYDDIPQDIARLASQLLRQDPQ